MFNFILAIQIIVAIAMVGLILLQHGKGADAGASFGSGASGTVFGAAGSANFLTRATAVLTAIFFATSLLLAIQARKIETDQRRLDVSEIETATPAPVIEPVATAITEETPTTVDNKASEIDTKTEEKVDTTTTTEQVETVKPKTVETSTEPKTEEKVLEPKETTPPATPEMTAEQIEKQLAIIEAETEELAKELEKSE